MPGVDKLSGDGGNRRGYVICCEQRSGSNLLCELLSSTGVLGTPLDYFNGPGLRAKGRPDYPQDSEAQLNAILDMQRGANGLYGLKIFSETADRVAYTNWNTRLPNLSYIWLTRKDLLSQAISSVRARQSAQWRSTTVTTAVPVYSSSQITAELTRLAQNEARWAIYFARQDIAPLEVQYEEILKGDQEVANRVGAFMSLPVKPTIDHCKIQLEIQRDALSAEWRVRYIAENAGRPFTINNEMRGMDDGNLRKVGQKILQYFCRI